jgi:hypothetical protein
MGTSTLNIIITNLVDIREQQPNFTFRVQTHRSQTTGSNWSPAAFDSKGQSGNSSMNVRFLVLECMFLFNLHKGPVYN